MRLLIQYAVGTTPTNFNYNIPIGSVAYYPCQVPSRWIALLGQTLTFDLIRTPMVLGCTSGAVSLRDRTDNWEIFMPAIYPYHHVVQDNEVEPDGYVSCLTYLLWTRSAALAHSAEHGWGEQRYLDIGAAWVVRSHAIQYLRPAFAGEEVMIETWVSRFQKTKSLRKYRISRPADDTLLVTAETNWALIDITKRRPCRIPTDLKEAFQIVPESEEPPMRPRSTAQATAD